MKFKIVLKNNKYELRVKKFLFWQRIGEKIIGTFHSYSFNSIREAERYAYNYYKNQKETIIKIFDIEKFLATEKFLKKTLYPKSIKNIELIHDEN